MASSNVSGATQQNRVRGTVGSMLEYGIKQEEIARAITELQFEVHLTGYRQSHVSSALKHHMARPSYKKESKEIIIKVWERAKTVAYDFFTFVLCLFSL